MKVQELTDALKAAGFGQEPLDSGCNYTKRVDHISLVCYVEPDIVVEFISIYHWNNNNVKGTYNIAIKDLNRSNDSIETFFKKTKNTIPQRIGESVDTHEQLDRVIEKVFR